MLNSLNTFNYFYQHYYILCSFFNKRNAAERGDRNFYRKPSFLISILPAVAKINKINIHWKYIIVYPHDEVSSVGRLSGFKHHLKIHKGLFSVSVKHLFSAYCSETSLKVRNCAVGLSIFPVKNHYRIFIKKDL
jgi:hypothetical protein